MESNLVEGHRNAVLDEAIAAVNALDIECVDQITALDTQDPARTMHRQHRHAYMQVFQRLDALREGASSAPLVVPERFQIAICDRVIAYHEAGGMLPSDPRELMDWIKEQIIASAEDRARVLPV